MGYKSNNKIKNKNNKTVNNKEEKSYKLSDEVTENIIISLVLILFLVIVCVVVIYVIRVNNPNSFKSEEELYEEVLANLIEDYNKGFQSDDIEQEETKTDKGTFSVLVDNILVEGKLPKQ